MAHLTTILEVFRQSAPAATQTPAGEGGISREIEGATMVLKMLLEMLSGIPLCAYDNASDVVDSCAAKCKENNRLYDH